MRLLPLIALLACNGTDPDPQDTGSEDSDTIEEPAPFPTGVVDLSAELETIRTDNGLPAVGAAKFIGGELTHLGVTGLRAADQTVEARWDDKWHLGSCTKAMTGTLVARLVEDGELTWDEPLSTLLPNTTMLADYEAITAVELLSHQAGLATNFTQTTYAPISDDSEVTAQRASFAEVVLGLDPAQPIGTYSYSNSGYMVVGAALEARTGKSWETLLTEEVFEPLEMDSCGFGNAAEAAVADQPWPHDSDGDPIPPGPGDDNVPALGPAGTVHCSMEDWGRFLAVHASQDTSYLPATQWTQLQTPVIDGYAMGWLVASRGWAEGTVFTHSGSNTMNYAVTWVAPEIDTVVVSVINQGDVFAAADAAIGVALFAP